MLLNKEYECRRSAQGCQVFTKCAEADAGKNWPAFTEELKNCEKEKICAEVLQHCIFSVVNIAPITAAADATSRLLL